MSPIVIEEVWDGGEPRGGPEAEPLVPQPTLINNPRALTNLTSTIAIPDIPRPEYLRQVGLEGYGTKITRITGDYGAPIANVGGYWGKVSVPHYSKDQAWNHDETMLHLEQRGSAEPSKLILNANTYQPMFGSGYGSNPAAGTYHPLLREATEVRWRPGFPTQMVSWVRSSQTLKVWDVLTQEVFWSVTVPSAETDKFGFLGEGVLSNNGRYVVLCSSYREPQTYPTTRIDHFRILDLQNKVVGPVNNLDVLPWTVTDKGQIDFCSISPLGNYVIVKYSDDQGFEEYARCFDVNLTTLACTPRTFLVGDQPLAMDKSKGLLTGWMSWMSHADFQLSTSPSLTGGAAVEVMVGGIRKVELADQNYCTNSWTTQYGIIVAQSMDKGKHLHISRGTSSYVTKEAEDQHTSGRNYLANGYILITHAYHTNSDGTQRKRSDEMVIYGIDASANGGAMIRLGTTRTNDGSGGYNAEAHGVPSPTFSKVMFASNWQRGVTSPGPVDDVKTYVLESLGDLAPIGDPAPDAHVPPVVV